MTGTQNMGEPGGATFTISVIRRILDVKRNADKKQMQALPVRAVITPPIGSLHLRQSSRHPKARKTAA